MCLGVSLQLFNVYFEAYQNALDPEERFALAQAIIDIMHKHPGFDLELQCMLTLTKMNIYVCNFTPLLSDIVNQQVG